MWIYWWVRFSVCKCIQRLPTSTTRRGYLRVWTKFMCNGTALLLTSRFSSGSKMLNDVFDKWFPDKFTDFKWTNGSNTSIGNESESMSAKKSVRNFCTSWWWRSACDWNGRKFIISIASPFSAYSYTFHQPKKNCVEHVIVYIDEFARASSYYVCPRRARTEWEERILSPLEMHFGIGDSICACLQRCVFTTLKASRLENKPPVEHSTCVNIGGVGMTSMPCHRWHRIAKSTVATLCAHLKMLKME